MFKHSLPYIAAIVIIGILYWIWIHPVLQRKNTLENKLEKKLKKLEDFYSSPQGPPSPTIIAAMEKGNKKLKELYLKVTKKLPVKEDYQLPESKNLSLYYMDQLQNMKRKLENKIQKTGLKIQTLDLGLPEELPSAEDAPELIRHLYTADTIVDLLVGLSVESGVRSIENIRVGEWEAKAGKDLYEEIPVSMKVNCDILSFTKLLSALENTKEEFLIIKGFNLVSERQVRKIVKEMPGESKQTPAPELETRYFGEEEAPPVPMDREFVQARAEKREVRTETVVEDTIKVDLALSIIRWKKL